MVDDLKAKGIILHNHICGNTIPIINDFIATGSAGVGDRSQDRPAEGQGRRPGQDLPARADRHGGPRVGNAREVEDACREAIAIMAPDSGFILGPGCALGAETPDENIHALVEAAQKYGRYQ